MSDESVQGVMPATGGQVPPATVAQEPANEQEKFDEAKARELIAKLREAEKEGNKAKKELLALKEAEQKRQEAEMTELQKAQKRADELAAALAAREHEATQRQVADSVGLPAILADRIKGKDADEMTADAKKLLESLPKGEKPKPTNINPTNPGSATPGETLAQKKSRLGLDRSPDLFSPAFNAGKDGGIFINNEE